MDKGFEVMTPIGWGLAVPCGNGAKKVEEAFGEGYEELLSRVRNAIYEWMDKTLYFPEVKALKHYYRADNHEYGGFDSGNFLMAQNYIVAYDVFDDAQMLEKAENCFFWAYRNCTEIHPMFTWQGGVRDGHKGNELYVKYTGDAFLAANALYRRTRKPEYLFYIKQFHNFFKQAKKAGFKYKYNTDTYKWSDAGYVWRSFGFPIVAYLELYELTGEKKYKDEAVEWGEHALSVQAENGCFYLLDGMFWNSDLTAPDLRGLVFLYEVTGEKKYLDAACRFADWLVKVQGEDGSWPIGIDMDGEVCAPNIGPGDMPNIAISLIRLNMHVDCDEYLKSIVKAIKYSLSLQAVEGGRYPLHLDDPKVKWGFWSWDPLYDYSLSGDQSIHHIRGILFASSYMASLPCCIVKQEGSKYRDN